MLDHTTTTTISPQIQTSPTDLSALRFMQSLKDAFAAENPDNDVKYPRFLSALKDYKSGRIDIRRLTQKCATLLKNHEEFTPAFNSFLPAGWSIILPSPSHPSSPQSALRTRRTRSKRVVSAQHPEEGAETLAFNKSLVFMEMVRARFDNLGERSKTYSDFVEALQEPLNSVDGLAKLRAKVKTIFTDHPDLDAAFDQFIPETTPSEPASEDTEVEDTNSEISCASEISRIFEPTTPIRRPKSLPDLNDNLELSDISSEYSGSLLDDSPDPTIRSISSPPSSVHSSPASVKRHSRLRSTSSDLMSLTLDAVIRDDPSRGRADSPRPEENLLTWGGTAPLPFYPTLSFIPPPFSYSGDATCYSGSVESTPNANCFFTIPTSAIEQQFNTTPNIDLRQNNLRTDFSNSVHQYAPILYPFNVTAHHKTTLEVRNWTWEASDPNPSRGVKRSVDSCTSPTSSSFSEPRRKKQVLRLSGGGSATGMFGAVGEGRPRPLKSATRIKLGVGLPSTRCL